MSAEPLRAPGPEAEQPPAPAAEAPRPASLNEALTGAPTPEAPAQPESLREKEDRLAREGMAKLNEMGKSFNTQAEAGVQEFKEETKSWWQRAKDKFKKKEDAPVKGEQDILREIEQADAVFADFRKKAAAIMVSGDEAGLRMLERSLSKTYDELAPQVAAEGAQESKQWKQALKTGEQPQMTEAGVKLNYVAKRLQDVRERLAGGEGPRTPITTEAAPVDPEAARVAAERESLLKGGKLKDGSEVKGFEGTPMAAMVDAYIARKALIGTKDSRGVIVGAGLDSRKMRDGSTEAVVTTRYEDGSELVQTASGRELYGMLGGPMNEVKPQAEIVEEETFTDEEKAELQAGAARLKESVEQMKAEQAVGARGEIESKPAAAPEAAQEPSVVLSPEISGSVPKTSEQALVASGEIVNTDVIEGAPAEAGEIEVQDADLIGGEPAPVQEAAPAPAAAETVPEPVAEAVQEAVPEPASSEDVSDAEMVKAQEKPLAPESMPAIVKAVGKKGKQGDGKFATPASFIQALEAAGFKMPSDMESDEPKKLHEAYKKALRAKT